MIGYCKQCGIPLFVEEAEHSAYCPFCKARRIRNPPEINPKTGEYEDGKPREKI